MIKEIESKIEELSQRIEKIEKVHYQPNSEEAKYEYYEYLAKLHTELDSLYRVLFSLKQEEDVPSEV